MFRTVDGRFQVVNVEYENSGGGCMVLVATVYDDLYNQMRYVLYNEEGGSLTTVDYVFSGVDYEDKMLLAYYDEEEHEAYYEHNKPVEDGETNELFEYCWLEFIKRDCKAYKTTLKAEAKRIPHALRNKIPAGYEEWLKENGQLIETDGERIIVDDRFKRLADVRKEVSNEVCRLKTFEEYLSHQIAMLDGSDEEVEEFYRMKITVSFGDMIVHISNSAAAFQALEKLIDEVLTEDYGCK